MKYKAGDKVIIRSDLTIGENYGGFSFTTRREKYRGTIMTIRRKDMFGDFLMEEDRCDSWWTYEMIQGLAPLVKDFVPSEVPLW